MSDHDRLERACSCHYLGPSAARAGIHGTACHTRGAGTAAFTIERPQAPTRIESGSLTQVNQCGAY
jgi:hypothetical protein